MKKQMHRLLSLMLSLILVVGLIPGSLMTAHAAENTGDIDDFNIKVGNQFILNPDYEMSGTGNLGGTWEYSNNYADNIPTVKLNNYKSDNGWIQLYDASPEGAVRFRIIVSGDCEITANEYAIVLQANTNGYLDIWFDDNATLTINGRGGIYNYTNDPQTRIESHFGRDCNGTLTINATDKPAIWSMKLRESSHTSDGCLSVSDGVTLNTNGSIHIGTNFVRRYDPDRWEIVNVDLCVENNATVCLKNPELQGYYSPSQMYPFTKWSPAIQVVENEGSVVHIYTPRFVNQTPAGSYSETTGQNVMVGEPQTYTFNSNTAPTGYYVEKTATLKGLFAGLDADKTVTVTDGSAVTINHTFVNAGLYQLTETLKLYKDGKDTPAATKTHVFLISVSNAPAILDDIEITWSAASMAHANGQEFDKSKIEVTAKYSDGSSKVLNDSDYTVEYQNGTALATGDTYVTIKYTEDGVTKTVKQSVSVADALHAFEFKSLDDLDFGTVEVGYSSVAYKNIIVKNTGSDFINLDYKISDTSKFRLSPYSDDLNAIEEGTSHTLQVYPVDGLPAGVYNETIRVYGMGALAGQEHTFNLKFVVSDGHEHTYTTGFNKSNEFYHWRECTDPACTASDKGRKDVTPHNWDIEHPVVVDPATCTEDGVGKIECTTCGAYQNTTVYATGHNWGEWPSYITPRCNEDPITITRTCENDESHTDSKTINGIHMATDWTTDETHHWKVCGYCETKILVEKDAHKDTNSDNKCDTCEYDMTPAVQPTEIDEIKIEGIPTPQIDQTIKEYYDIIKSKHNAGTLTVNGDMYNYENERYGNLQTGGVYFEDENYCILEASSNEPITAGTYYYCTFFAPIEGYVFADDVEVNVPGATEVEIFNDDGEIGVYVKFVLTESAPTEYNITVTGGTASANKAVAGTVITLTVDESAIPAGKVFDKWEVVSGGVTVADGKFTMPESAVEIKATYKDAPVSHTCDIKPVAKDEPSCTEGGKEAYYKCEGCGKFYEDALGAKEITDLANWGNLPKLGHTESDWKSDKDNHWKECTVTACGVIIEDSKAAHKDDNKDGKCDVCEYNVGLPTTPDDDKPNDNPQTGDNSNMFLWIALLFISGAGVVATTVFGKKKFSVK